MSSQWGIIVKFFIAVLLGAVIGAERDSTRKPAGFRTQAFIAGASCLLMCLKYFLYSPPDSSSGVLRPDPFNLVNAIVSGISFIAAGAIIQKQSPEVRGLTTAASLLMSSVIGMYVAIGQYGIAAAVTLLCFAALHFLKFIPDEIRSEGRSHP